MRIPWRFLTCIEMTCRVYLHIRPLPGLRTTLVQEKLIPDLTMTSQERTWYVKYQCPPAPDTTAVLRTHMTRETVALTC